MKKVLVSLLSIALIGCSMPISNNTSQYSDLDKEYSQFKTEALTQSYLKKKMDKWLSDNKYSKNLVREIEYAKFKHKDLLKDIVSFQPIMFDNITANTGINQKRVESPFENYIQYINPYPSAVTANSATNITVTSFTANWESASNATSYKLFVNDNEVYSGANTSFDITGLTTGTIYNYYVKAVNNAGDSPNSNTISLALNPDIPVTPTTLAATNITSTSFTANWNSVSGATSYKLKIDSGVWNDVGAVTSFDVTGLTAGTTHNYYVQASNTSGTSNSSIAQAVTLLPATPAVPVANIASSVTSTSFRANWSSVSGTTGYKLYIDGTLAYTGTNLYFDKSGVVSGTTHTYYVQSYNTGGTSANSNEIFVSLITNLTEVQSIPTNGGQNFKFITIGTNNYIISSNYFNGSTYNLSANIYKWNTSTSKFDSTAIQSIPTNGNAYTEFFTIGTEHYLAIANQYNGSTFNVNLKIYKWNTSTSKFDSTAIQSIPTNGAVGLKSFKIGTNNYLAISYPYDGSSNYTNINIFKWNTSTSKFDTIPYQAIPSYSPYDLEIFTIGTDNYIAVTNYNNLSYPAKIYKWNGSSFVEFQSISTNLSYNWEHFQIGTDHYLAIANYSNTSLYNTDSKIYKWNGSSFVEFQSIATNGGHSWKFFTIGSDNYLAIANYYNGSSYNINSKIYKWNSSSFVEWQSIATNGAVGWEYFTIGEYNYLVLSNYFNGSSYNINSKIYRLD